MINRRAFTLVVAATALLALVLSAEARPERQTQGRSCGLVLDGLAIFETFSTRTKSGVEIQIDGVIMKPAGNGPFPALVLSHGGYGIMPPDCHRHAMQAFTAWGYVVLLVDSFSAHHPERNRHGKHTFVDQAQDVYAAMAYLGSRPFVNSNRIGLVSWSYGGTATLIGLTSDRSIKSDRSGQFQAAAVFYPMCLNRMDGLAVPLLVLIGEADQETPAARCQAMAVAGKTLELQTYPNVRHAFDFPGARNFDPVAARKAFARLKGFLEQHIR